MRASIRHLFLFAVSLIAISCASMVGASSPDAMASLSAEAHSRLAQGDLAGAETLFLRILGTFPAGAKAPDAKLWLAYVKLQRNLAPKEELIATFEAVDAAYPDTPEGSEGLFKAAQCRLRKIHGVAAFDDAIAAFDRAAAHSRAPRQQKARCKMQAAFVHIMRHYTSKDLADVRTAASRLVGCSTEFADIPAIQAHSLLGTGEAQILLGNYEAAEQAYARVAGMDSQLLPFETSVGILGVGMAKAWRRDDIGAATSLQRFLDGIPGSTIAAKDTAWRASYPADYAREGLSSVGFAAVQLAWGKHRAGDSVAGCDLLDQVRAVFADQPKVLSRATSLKQMIMSSPLFRASREANQGAAK